MGSIALLVQPLLSTGCNTNHECFHIGCARRATGVKPDCTIGTLCVAASKHQDVEVEIELNCGPKTLNHCDRSGLGAADATTCQLSSNPAEDLTDGNGEYTSAQR